jgi:hypothetical protein
MYINVALGGGSQLRTHKSFHAYMAVQWNGVLFTVRGLSMGLESAPAAQQRVAEEVARILRRHVPCEPYYDDFCTGTWEREWVTNAAASGVWPEVLRWPRDPALRHNVFGVFMTLGFVLGRNKCTLSPQQIIEFLGYILNSIAGTVHLTDRRAQRLLQLARGTKCWGLGTILSATNQAPNLCMFDVMLPRKGAREPLREGVVVVR